MEPKRIDDIARSVATRRRFLRGLGGALAAAVVGLPNRAGATAEVPVDESAVSQGYGKDDCLRVCRATRDASLRLCADLIGPLRSACIASAHSSYAACYACCELTTSDVSVGSVGIDDID
jgi:hypothetical protein